MKEIRDNARKLMKGFCRVCPVCDGKACAGEVPGMGGINTGNAFKRNVSALREVTLNMRLLHDVTDPDPSSNVLGLDLAMPVMAAPIGGVSFNMGGGMEEQDYVDAILGGCKDAGVIGCTGDGVPEFIYKSAFDGITKFEGHGIPFIKPWEGGEFEEKLDMAAKTGCSVLGMDIDAAGLITLRLMGRPVSPKSPAQLKEVADMVHDRGLKFILKGIMDPREAVRAAEAGADAIVISNHGGRVLDHTPGTAEVLTDVAEEVKGSAIIMVDGGVRDGFDVLKMVALGADCVLIGRPFCYAAIGGGRDGVVKYLGTIMAQLKQSMVLTGCKDIASAGLHILYDAF
ncbi:alpha-hydroxy-acid oxidizing protein [Salidesulfovibrio onnuriiensis]|uniref:alpha-hydroxy-acid oxidizing protein n=1 Tax=Salidesulfovibrio onnuriiensis TaxID=2583823 RepID=UPI0011CAF610|nr:alpha-hydroxy-acid oxidizing protein [Salidesulfovibrio onnuriiensis]